MLETFLMVLVGLTIVGALIAVETRNLLSAVVSLSAVGFGLSIAFLLLGAPDVAITQIIVEILCLIILIRATIRRDVTTIAGDREFFGLVMTLLLIFAIFLFAVHAFQYMPEFGKPVALAKTDSASVYYINNAYYDTYSSNVLSAILLDYRVLDTFGAMTILFAATVGALAVLRKKAKKEGMKDEQTRA